MFTLRTATQSLSLFSSQAQGGGGLAGVESGVEAWGDRGECHKKWEGDIDRERVRQRQRERYAEVRGSKQASNTAHDEREKKYRAREIGREH